jgi:DNA-binding MarR family transcriptional regulator
MEISGFVRRVPDGRAYRIHLTETGRSLLETVLPELERIIAEQFAGLPAAEREQLFRLVEAVDPGSE